MATFVRAPERLEDGSAGLSVIVAQNRFESRGGSLQMVVGNADEQVVSHMGADIVVDVIDQAVIAVNGGEGTFEKIPVFAAIPGDIRLGVVQKGNQVQPDHKNDVWPQVVFYQKHPAILIGQPAQQGDHQRPAGGAGKHVPFFRGSKQGVAGEKVGTSRPCGRAFKQVEGIDKE